jgi:2-polyprenyl-6-methoxyphenol hydroxylase-like FAD-dependent oxidoreductase
VTPPPLIVGAGPTGLAAALFLARMGVRCRIVDAAPSPATTSKALGVNPRTLTILADTGLSERIMGEGRRITALHAHDRGRPLARVELDFSAIGAAYPMVILPQARTEALLAEALGQHGISVERGLGLTVLAQTSAGVDVELTDGQGQVERADAPIVLGADGSHSAVRHALGLSFDGDAFPEMWELMDVDLQGPPPDAGWADFQHVGPFVALPYDDRTWRLIGFGGPLLDRAPAHWTRGEVRWASSFKVSHRVAGSKNVGRVCLAGDAAHIHSPIGARGMNLGIEDAYVFAHCAKAFLDGDGGKLAAYGAERLDVDRGVVRRVRRLTNGVRATGEPGRTLRRLVLPLAAKVPALRNTVARQGFGLDHPLRIP